MRKKTMQFGLVGAAVLVAAAAVASPFVMPVAVLPAPEVVEIVVSAEDYERCVATLEQVFLGPVIGGEVQTVALEPDDAVPTVACVIES